MSHDPLDKHKSIDLEHLLIPARRCFNYGLWRPSSSASAIAFQVSFVVANSGGLAFQGQRLPWKFPDDATAPSAALATVLLAFMMPSRSSSLGYRGLTRAACTLDLRQFDA